MIDKTTTIPEFNDARVQAVYGLLCDDQSPPDGEHWEGWVARRIIAALQSAQPAAAGVSDEAGKAFYELSCEAWGIRPSWSALNQDERDRQRQAANRFLALRPQADTLCFELSAMLGCPPSDTDVVACVSSLLTPRPQALPMTDEQLCAALGIDGSDDWTYKVRDVVEAFHRIGVTQRADGGENQA